MKIVPGTHEDLIKRYGEEIIGSFLEEILKKGTAKYYLIYDDDELKYDYWTYDEFDGIANLHLLQSISDDIIIDLIMIKLKEEGYKRVVIEILKEDNDKFKFYKNCGFSEFKSDVIMMTRVL